MRIDTKEMLKLFNQRGCGPDCPVCHMNNWIANGNIVAAVPLEKDGSLRIDKKEEIVPMVRLMCNNCGNLLFFDPIVMGIQLNFDKES